MDVVDLTDSVLDTARRHNANNDTLPDRTFPEREGLPSRLEPQAAAACQSGVKRKLPDTFLKQPARAKKGQQVSAARFAACASLAPQAIRQAAVRINPDPAQSNLAAFPAAGIYDTLNGSEDMPRDQGLYAASNTSMPDPQTSQPVQDKPVSGAQRRIPESLVKLQSGSTSQSKVPGSRSIPAAPAYKSGPSEHDTKVQYSTERGLFK